MGWAVDFCISLWMHIGQGYAVDSVSETPPVFHASQRHTLERNPAHELTGSRVCHTSTLARNPAHKLTGSRVCRTSNERKVATLNLSRKK